MPGRPEWQIANMSIEALDLPLQSLGMEGVMSERATMPIKEARALPPGFSKGAVAWWAQGLCALCGQDHKASSLGVPLCSKCSKQVPNTTTGGDIIGILLMYWVVADIWGEPTAHELVSTTEAWNKWRSANTSWEPKSKFHNSDVGEYTGAIAFCLIVCEGSEIERDDRECEIFGK